MADVLTDEMDKFAQSLRVILPTVEKWRSDSVDDAGITRICFPSLDSRGILWDFLPHHARKSNIGSLFTAVVTRRKLRAVSVKRIIGLGIHNSCSWTTWSVINLRDRCRCNCGRLVQVASCFIPYLFYIDMQWHDGNDEEMYMSMRLLWVTSSQQSTPGQKSTGARWTGDQVPSLVCYAIYVGNVLLLFVSCLLLLLLYLD